MALPDITDLTLDELRQLGDIAYTEANRRSRLTESPSMVAETLVRVHEDGGDYAQVSASGLQIAEERIAALGG